MDKNQVGLPNSSYRRSRLCSLRIRHSEVKRVLAALMADINRLEASRASEIDVRAAKDAWEETRSEYLDLLANIKNLELVELEVAQRQMRDWRVARTPMEERTWVS